jgi:hypothetical protein
MYDNCFGSNGRNGCNILTVHKCLQDKCSFYKSTQELEEASQGGRFCKHKLWDPYPYRRGKPHAAQHPQFYQHYRQ